jgi:hypothetical protein
MARLIEVGAARLPNSGGDLLIVLNEPDGGIPASVVIHWPGKPTTIHPARFGDLAAAMVRLFSDAHVTLTRVKGRRLR